MKRILFSLIFIFISVTLFAQSDSELDLDYAHVLMVKAVDNGETWRFDVSLRHGDTGWDHYANLWVVVDAETGEEYGRRVLAHPHTTEQPFTRSQSGLVIPEEVTAVIVKAACNIHGFGGREWEVILK